jgi:hypothetical protein
VSETVTLKRFTVTCQACGAPAAIESRDNGACGDRACCGDYREYVVLVCRPCGIEEQPD